MNANPFFSSSVNSELSIYFADRADEVEKVLRQLRSGREVPLADINSALDTSYAKRIASWAWLRLQPPTASDKPEVRSRAPKAWA